MEEEFKNIRQAFDQLKTWASHQTSSYLTKIARSVVSAHTNMVSVVSVILSQSHEVVHQAPKTPPPVCIFPLPFHSKNLHSTNRYD
jgi:hypothetical protein